MEIHAQNKLTYEYFGLNEGRFSKQKVEYFNPGDRGPNCFWDFTGLKVSPNTAVPFVYKIDSIGRYIAIEDKQINYYFIKGDTLFEIGNESPLKETFYHKPIVNMSYPMALGDSVSVPFAGYGYYCGDHFFKESGVNTVLIDAEGSIVLSETDTLRNVLRVYKLKSYYIAMDMEPAAIDTARLKQVIEERYEWYARGYRYPIFETVTSTSYSDLDPIGITQYAYCFLPDKQDVLEDIINRNLQSLDSINESIVNKDIIHYHVSMNGYDMKINYSLDKAAKVSMLISNTMGIIYRHSHSHLNAGEGYCAEFNLSGLNHGAYVLYINVNGKIYSEKIRI